MDAGAAASPVNIAHVSLSSTPIRRLPLALLAPALAALALAAGCERFNPRERPARQFEGADSAAQVLLGARHVVTVGGARRAILTADSAILDEDVSRVELRRVRMVFYGPAGDSIAWVTAPAARYDLAALMVEARDGVVVQSSGGRTLNTPRLRFDARRNMLVGDSTWQTAGPGGGTSGTAFEADPALRSVSRPKPPARDSARRDGTRRATSTRRG